jgi:hypothetical protein
MCKINNNPSTTPSTGNLPNTTIKENIPTKTSPQTLDGFISEGTKTSGSQKNVVEELIQIIKQLISSISGGQKPNQKGESAGSEDATPGSGSTLPGGQKEGKGSFWDSIKDVMTGMFTEGLKKILT